MGLLLQKWDANGWWLANSLKLGSQINCPLLGQFGYKKDEKEKYTFFSWRRWFWPESTEAPTRLGESFSKPGLSEVDWSFPAPALPGRTQSALGRCVPSSLAAHLQVCEH